MILQRDNEDLFGTHGEMLDNYNKPIGIYALEQNWKDNQEGISCIPPGDYICSPHKSVHLRGILWHVTPVVNRIGILIHGGDVLKDTHGCILLGLDRNKQGVWRSQDALAYLATLVPPTGFRLRIRAVGDNSTEVFN